MKLALISDIHGNLTALDRVLTALAEEGIEEIVCLGDAAVSGPQPQAVLARLRELECRVVLGNADAEALTLPDKPPGMDERIREIGLWSIRQLSADDLAFIRTFQDQVALTLGAYSFLGFHGSPASFNDIINVATPEEELARYFAPYSAQILAGGHTHVQMVRRYRDALLINPGSVGLPWEKAHSSEDLYNPLRAEYAVLTIEGGDLRVELRRVTYPFDGLAAAVHDQAMPHAEWWLSDWR
ncbi:MAG: metallophosphoesterase family protein [Caldilineaceae bacterium]|nr:metallophosphoesterase family protein [Caldilineaceae bacterium]